MSLFNRCMAFVVLFLITGSAWAQLTPEQHVANDRVLDCPNTDTHLTTLNATGQLECSHKPKLSNFLVGEEKARLEEIETYDPDLEANAEEAEVFRRSFSSGNPIDSVDLNRYERQQLAEGERLLRLRVEKKALEEKARRVAKERCFHLESAQIVTPEVIQTGPCRQLH